MFNSRRLGLQPVLLLGVLCVPGCAENAPVPLLDVTPSIDLPDSVLSAEPFEIAYRWDPGKGFDAEGRDYLVFVHMVDDEGNLVAQDDHALPTPTSEWRPGNPIEYRRWFRFLDPIDVENIDIVIGLYDEDGRASLRGFEQPAYSRVGGLRIRLDGEEGVPLRGTGWYKLERSPETNELWHWIGDEATAVFANPRRDSMLHMEASAPVSLIESPQQVRVFLHDVEIAEFSVSTDDRFRQRIPVSAELLGNGEFVEFRIAVGLNVVSSEVIPGSVSDRRLGLKVFYLHLGLPGTT